MDIASCMKRAGLGLALAALASSAAAASPADRCLPPGYDLAAFEALKARQWKVDDFAKRQLMALDVSRCLADPDPHLRDELAFEALSSWMRGRQLDPATLVALSVRMLNDLEPAAADATGVRRPFAALLLSEIARVDRLQPFMVASGREQLVAKGTAYLSGVRDYRGFEPGVGWRHGVAHGADLMLQLVLNPAVGPGQIDRILAAVASQIAPPVPHAYVFGEGERLMRPVFYAGQRGLLTLEEWNAWFASLDVAGRTKAEPPTLAALAARHDLGQFLNALYVSLKENGTPEMQARMLPGLLAALKALG